MNASGVLRGSMRGYKDYAAPWSALCYDLSTVLTAGGGAGFELLLSIAKEDRGYVAPWQLDQHVLRQTRGYMKVTGTM